MACAVLLACTAAEVSAREHIKAPFAADDPLFPSPRTLPHAVYYRLAAAMDLDFASVEAGEGVMVECLGSTADGSVSLRVNGAVVVIRPRSNAAAGVGSQMGKVAKPGACAACSGPPPRAARPVKLPHSLARGNILHARRFAVCLLSHPPAAPCSPPADATPGAFSSPVLLASGGKGAARKARGGKQMTAAATPAAAEEDDDMAVEHAAEAAMARAVAAASSAASLGKRKGPAGSSPVDAVPGQQQLQGALGGAPSSSAHSPEGGVAKRARKAPAPAPVPGLPLRKVGCSAGVPGPAPAAWEEASSSAASSSAERGQGGGGARACSRSRA